MSYSEITTLLWCLEHSTEYWNLYQIKAHWLPSLLVYFLKAGHTHEQPDAWNQLRRTTLMFPTATGFPTTTKSIKPITNHNSKFNCEKKREWDKAEFHKQTNNPELSDYSWGGGGGGWKHFLVLLLTHHTAKNTSGLPNSVWLCKY